MIAAWAKQWLVSFNPSKTVAIIFSTVLDLVNPSLLFDNTIIEFVDNHKHLGLTFSKDGKWHAHIDNILTSASRTLGILRSLKYRLGRKAMTQIYLSYLRPLLEYASVVWDGCTQYEKTKLERIQYEAARLVTGLTRSVSIENLIKEIGWLSLSERRHFQKAVTMFKIKNGLAPDYLNKFLPPLVSDRTPYNLRNASNVSTVRRRTELFARSFMPSAVELWNSLPAAIQNINSLDNFKRALKNSVFITPKVPSFYIKGNRRMSIYHARLRNKCSDLNNDLYVNHIKEVPTCECGVDVENAEHYFFKCVRFAEQRLALYRATRQFHPLNTNKLLYGVATKTDAENLNLFSAIHQFIKATERFN